MSAKGLFAISTCAQEYFLDAPDGGFGADGTVGALPLFEVPDDRFSLDVFLVNL